MNFKNLTLAAGALAVVVGSGAIITNLVSARSERAETVTASLPSQAMQPELPAQAGGALAPSESSIVDIVLADDGEFDVLQAAVVKADLVGALSGDNQLTVFAPTDQAFINTLGATDEADAIATVESMPVEDLTNILLYHVTEGRRNSQSVLAAPHYEMLNGSQLSQEELVAAGIADTDISASNGLIHVIDGVLMPSTP